MKLYENTDSNWFEESTRILNGTMKVASLLVLKYRDDVLQQSYIGMPLGWILGAIYESLTLKLDWDARLPIVLASLFLF